MKRLTSYLLVAVMLLSCFATIFATTAMAAPVIISVGKSYTTTAPLHPSMPDDNYDLTDGSKGNPNVGTNANGPYVGYSIDTAEIILDLGTAQYSNVFTIYTAGGFWGISVPGGLSISYSNSASGPFENASGALVTQYTGDGDVVDGFTSKLYTFTFTSEAYISARYIKYTIPCYGNNYIWLDEIEAAFDASLSNTVIPGEALHVHHVNKIVNANEISVFTDYSAFSSSDLNGWGVYHQLRATGNTNEYLIVDSKNNPGTKYSEGEWNFTHVAGDIYMQINGAAANAAVYNLTTGGIVTFFNLTLATGDYTNTYVYAGTYSNDQPVVKGPVIVDYTTSVAPRSDYPDNGRKLIDGVKSDPNVAVGTDSYVGYTVSGTMDLILDLGTVKDTDSYTLYTAENFFGVWTPSNVTISCSNSLDGVYTYVSSTMEKIKAGEGTPYNNGTNTYTPQLYAIKVTPDKIVSARYIKLTITPNGSYIWLDEVEATLAENSSNKASYTVSSDLFHADNRADDGNKLTDGIRSSVDFSGSNYVAWQNVDSVDITLNLGEIKSTDTYSIYGIENFWGVWTPNTISVAYSDSADGEFKAIDGNVSKIFIGEGNAYQSSNSVYYTSQLYEIRLTANEAVDAQYIRVTVPANGTYIWIDEVSATLGAVSFPEPVPTAYDPSKPNTKCNVNHVNKAAGTNEISVFTTIDDLYACENGWGMYYQLRATPNVNEFTVVAACSNPHDNYADNNAELFKQHLGFTYTYRWSLPASLQAVLPANISDIYMVVKGAAANPSVYNLEVGNTITFTNLTYATGDYTNTTVMGSAASGTVSGMIDNEITETNFAHALANVQKVNASSVVEALSADNAPADAFFGGSNLDYNAILTACIQNKVLPTIQIDSAANATALIAAMRSTGCYDVNVISSNAAILAQVRAATTIPRTGLIYNLTKSTVSSTEAAAIRATVRSAPASFVVLGTANISKQVVSELQELGVAVWVKIDTASGTTAFNVEAVNALATGVNGIITDDSANIYNLIDSYFLKDTFTHTPVLVGHKGYYYDQKAIENTMKSFIAAYELGVDIFELDVYSTTDNALPIFHDSTFNNGMTTYTGNVSIENMTKAQVQAVTYKKDGSPITMLDDVLAYFQDKDVRIFIEIKGSGIERTVKAIANAVKAYNMEDRICIISAAGSYINYVNTYLPGMTSSYVYANVSLTTYAPYHTPAWEYAETREENLAILSFTLNVAQTWNANISPALGAVSMGYRTKNYMGEATANRGVVLNPWTYGSDWANNIGFFSKVDSITTDIVPWFHDMAKFVSAEDITLVKGQTYNGSGFTATTYGKDTYNIDVNNIVYSIVDGDCVEVQNGRLVAVKDGEAKILLGYKTKTASDVEYVLYSEVITVTVDSDNIDVLRPLIALAKQMTVNDFNETDLIELRRLHKIAVELVNSNSTDAEAITETAIALSTLLDKRYVSTTQNVAIGSYERTEPNYLTWPTDQLDPTYADDKTRLIDGVKNSPNVTSNAYSVWQNVDTEIIVDMGSVVKADVFNGYFAAGEWGVSAPGGMTISYQDASGNWQTADTAFKIEASGTSGTWTLYKATATASETVEARYFKFTIHRSGIFVWMDEVEVLVENVQGDKVRGDYIYITGINKKVDNGDAVIYTSLENADFTWKMNLIAEWNEYQQAYVVIDGFYGTDTYKPDITLKEGQILISVHDWESGVTDGSQVVGSAKNMANASKASAGKVLYFYGIDLASGELDIAPYIRAIDSDHTHESNGDDWATDEKGHWHVCVCGEIVDYSEHTPGEKADCENDQTCVDCEYVIEKAKGHNYSSVVTEPTCTEQGYTTHTCANCGDSYVDSYVDAKDHNYIAVVTEPTCTGQGYTTHTCEYCDDVYVDSYTDMISHTPGEEADCENDQICTVCGEVLANAIGHDYTSVVTPPTCTGQGYTTYTCENCGDSYADDYTDMLPHTPGTKADCENDQICTVCGTVLEAAHGHHFEWVVTKEAEVGVEGVKEYICSECNTVDESKTQTIPALSDEEDDWMLGDVNKNGSIDMTDYIMVKRAYFGTLTFDDDQTRRGDCNQNGGIDMTDYIMLKRAYFGTLTLVKRK